MRFHLPLVILLASSLPGVASAQLQWLSSPAPGSAVQPASHDAPAVESAPARPRAKAPVTPKTMASKPRASQPKANQTQPSKRRVMAASKRNQRQAPAEEPAPADLQKVASLANYVADRAAMVDPASRGIVDQNVEPVCHSNGYGDCGCTDSYACETSCGFPEAGCGLTYGESCGCGDVGCAGECYDGCCGECGCGDVCGCGDTCGPNSFGGCSRRGAIPLILFLPPVQELTLYGGVQAFKNPLDGPLSDRGNFGFHGGFNLGGNMAWLPFPNLGYQIGYQGVHSQLHGDSAAGESDSHTQQFVTAGLFSRRPVGLQYGVVYDLLRDERQENVDFGQVRGQISLLNPCGNEFGFMFTSGTSDNLINGATYEAVSRYLLFYRVHGCQGGEFGFFGGGTDEGQGILGADLEVPLSDRYTFQTGFTYLVPEDSSGGVGGSEEAWNLGMNLVWHYGKRGKSCFKAPFRPMFDVADNGSLIVDDR